VGEAEGVSLAERRALAESEGLAEGEADALRAPEALRMPLQLLEAQLLALREGADAEGEALGCSEGECAGERLRLPLPLFELLPLRLRAAEGELNGVAVGEGVLEPRSDAVGRCVDEAPPDAEPQWEGKALADELAVLMLTEAAAERVDEVDTQRVWVALGEALPLPHILSLGDVDSVGAGDVLPVADAQPVAVAHPERVAKTLTVPELQSVLVTVGDDEGLPVDDPVEVPVLDSLALVHPLEVPDEELHAVTDSEVVTVSVTVPEVHPELVTVG
jgi:hypothetical protein